MKRPPWSYLIVTCAVFITILVGVAAASLPMNRFSGEEVGAASLGMNGHLTLMTPGGSTVTDQSFRGQWLLIYFGYTFSAPPRRAMSAWRWCHGLSPATKSQECPQAGAGA
ncbi:MAG TPA: hypothetical protein VEK55_09785 [Xanthobacteraceae bacterium]|nr:hypothetical protein [Xanthobacteraceae bacterium]